MVFWSIYSIPFVKLIIFILNFFEYCSFTLRLKSGTADFPTLLSIVIVVYYFLDSCTFTYISELAHKFINTKMFAGILIQITFNLQVNFKRFGALRILSVFLCEHHGTLDLSRSLILSTMFSSFLFHS